MPRPASDARAPPPSLAGAPWLEQASTRAVLAALERAGYEGRIVGGTVRNALMGLPVTDVDIATPARPEEVVAACTAAGLATVPTGISHGTVTVIADHRPIEVTTLRRDLETDGRRAVVAFTRDWVEDARRRDFTMNALYCAADGNVFDPVCGWPDLVARRVRFIGDPDSRIREDYLRILRYFRFHATYATGAPDPAALAACARGLQGVPRLSAERIRAELVKLLVAPGVVGAVGAMQDVGLLPVVLGAAPRPGVLGAVVAAEAAQASAPDAMLRLSALAIAVAGDIPRLSARLRLSNAEEKALLVLDHRLAGLADGLDVERARRTVYELGAAGARRRALALAALRPDRPDAGQCLLIVAAQWTPPTLPVSGADLMTRGLAPGPRIGAVLAEVESWWLANGFPDRQATVAFLDRLLATGRASGAS